MERGEGAIYRCGRGIELGQHLIELKRRNQCGGSVTGVDFGPGKKNLTGGSRSLEGEREERDTGSGGALLGHGLASSLGRKGSLRSSFIFLFSFLLFFF
jgi:hypothetical protein